MKRFTPLFFYFFTFYTHVLIFATNGQFQLSPYWDTNVQESLTHPFQSYGLKLRGDLYHEFSHFKWKVYEDVIAQAFLDIRYRDESKLILNPHISTQYRAVSNILITSQLSYFHKTFFEQKRAYKWLEFYTSIRMIPLNKFTTSIGYDFKATTYTSVDKYRFYEQDVIFKAKYRPNSPFTYETIFALGMNHYLDTKAWKIEKDTILVPLQKNQEDKLIQSVIHFRYQSKIIFGVLFGLEWVKSNSVVSEYTLGSFRSYLSGRIRESYYYHFVYQQVDKEYRYPQLPGISRYRDPEERIQNRSYVQLEYVMMEGKSAFFKISLFENETILNQRYYDKTMIEVGIKYKL